METASVADFVEENLKTIYALSRVSNNEDAEDLASDIVIAILQSKGKLKTPEAFYGYIWGIAANTYRKFLQKRSNRQSREESIERTESSVSEKMVVDGDFAEEFREKIYKTVAGEIEPEFINFVLSDCLEDVRLSRGNWNFQSLMVRRRSVSARILKKRKLRQMRVWRR